MEPLKNLKHWGRIGRWVQWHTNHLPYYIGQRWKMTCMHDNIKTEDIDLPGRDTYKTQFDQ